MDIAKRLVLGAESEVPRIKALRATHHKLAQCLAMNFSDAEASIATGYSPSRISILKQDPAFKELQAFYAEARDKVFVDVQQRMAGFATDALEVLQERLEVSPQVFTNKELNELIKTTADRGGHSPVQKSESKTIVLTAKELEDIKKGVETAQNGQVRKINQAEEVVRVKAREGLQEDSESSLSANDNGTSSIVLEETPPEGG